MKFTKPQSIVLDLARGISAQLVLVGHVMRTAELQNQTYLYQNLGVAAFFILSGMLITNSILSKSEGYAFTDYLIDRAARIFVPYVPAVIFIVAVSLPLRDGPTDPFTVVANLLMLEDFPLHHLVNWFPEIDRVGTGRPLWSVAAEWWFYMAAAVVYFKANVPRWSWLLILPGLFVMAFASVGGSLGIVWIAGGCSAVLFFQIPKARPLFWLMASLAFSVMAPARLFLVKGNFYDLQFSLLLLIALVCFLKLIETSAWVERFESPARGLAAYSYSLYLTHYTVMSALKWLHGWSFVIVTFVAANLIAIAMWWLFERHHRTIAKWVRGSLSSHTQPTISDSSIAVSLPSKTTT